VKIFGELLKVFQAPLLFLGWQVGTQLPVLHAALAVGSISLAVVGEGKIFET
jgi:hypothetical protein